jgi:predicted NUDIX family NTP pyrophosphohydrolase
LEAAKREFEEELGSKADGTFIQLSPIKQKSGKIVHAWAFAGDCDPGSIRSNMFSMEWPPHSRRTGTFPEVDRAAFFKLKQAKTRINPAQVPLLEELRQKLACGA